MATHSAQTAADKVLFEVPPHHRHLIFFGEEHEASLPSTKIFKELAALSRPQFLRCLALQVYATRHGGST
jgi:hypothetical protein